MTKEEENKKFAQEELAKIIQKLNQENNPLTEEEQTSVINHNNKACYKSCSKYEEEVKGEYYQSKEEDKKEIITNIGRVLAAVGIAMVVVIGTMKLGQMETAGDIQKEINRRITVQNIIGGSYEEKYVYSDDFRNYMNSCGEKLLIQEFNEAKEEMKLQDDPLINPKVSDIVSYMEGEYLEENKGMVR